VRPAEWLFGKGRHSCLPFPEQCPGRRGGPATSGKARKPASLGTSFLLHFHPNLLKMAELLPGDGSGAALGVARREAKRVE
jgi:hypothetical protein